MRLFSPLLVVLVLAAACGDASGPGGSSDTRTMTVYSGRSEELVGPLIEMFESKTGITADVRYGDTAELASQLLEEGDRTRADVFFAQDAGALGAVSKQGLFAALPQDVLDMVPERFRAADGRWVGTSGRARVAVYNRGSVGQGALPGSVLDLTQPAWKDRVAWAPTNGSFQAFVTAMRKTKGDDAARLWLEQMKANGAKSYEGNSAIVNAVASGEIDLGLVNHYYVLELSAQDPSIGEKAANHFFAGGDPGSLINVAGVGVIGEATDESLGLVRFLLSGDGTQYFSKETYEYPLVETVKPDPRLPPLESIEQPDIDLSDLDDLNGTLDVLREVGLL